MKLLIFLIFTLFSSYSFGDSCEDPPEPTFNHPIENYVKYTKDKKHVLVMNKLEIERPSGLYKTDDKGNPIGESIYKLPEHGEVPYLSDDGSVLVLYNRLYRHSKATKYAYAIYKNGKLVKGYSYKELDINFGNKKLEMVELKFKYGNSELKKEFLKETLSVADNVLLIKRAEDSNIKIDLVNGVIKDIIHNGAPVELINENYLFGYDSPEAKKALYYLNRKQKISVDDLKLLGTLFIKTYDGCYSRYHWNSSEFFANSKNVFTRNKYRELSKLDGFNPDTFKIINEDPYYYVKDSNHIYFGHGDIITGDTTTFKIIDSYHFQIEDRVYITNKIIEYDDGLDHCYYGPYFELVLAKKVGNHKYSPVINLYDCEEDTVRLKDGAVYNPSKLEDYKLIPNIFCKDESLYYSKGEEIFFNQYGDSLVKIEDAKTTSFEYFGDFYLKSNEKIFYEEKLISKIGETFNYLGAGYSSDGTNLFYRGKVIQIIDQNIKVNVFPNSVAFVGQIKLMDGKVSDLLNDVDIKSFHQINSNYFADDKNVYEFNMNKLIYDSKTFEDLGYGYTRDKNGVYFERKLIPEVDAKSFVSISENLAKDAKFAYWKDEKFSPEDLDSLRPLNSNYSKDKKAVYFKNNIVENINPKSFRVINEMDGKDFDTGFLIKNGDKYVSDNH